ncbi:MAG: 2,3,4,5-tetrahydropyridine-2,6-dicarboxylate N-succinyltransferase [Sulfitobacter sp.]
MKDIVEEAFGRVEQITSDDADIIEVLKKGIDQISRGELRAAEQIDGEWVVNEWVKKMILIYFRTNPAQIMPTGFSDPEGREMNAFDKIGLKTAGWDASDFSDAGFRMVPGAMVREGSFVAKTAVLMPCFVNIGAYVGEGTMIDTWSTVGSCAQIGAKCHISGGVGIGGVLEPLNARPVIIEDGVFVGARSEVAEGVIVRKNAVISMGVFLGASTPILNRMTGEVTYGEIPENAVVLPGSRPIEMKEGGTVNMPCAVIVKFADEKTRGKVSLNDLVRD